MFGINLKHRLAIVAVAGGVLAAAGSASAATHQPGLIVYDGHAGLGASAYQHNQTDLEFFAPSPQGPGSEGFWLGSNDALAAGVTDGTSNTIMVGERAAADIETIESPAVFAGDAYDNEMGLRAARFLPDIGDEVA